MSHTREIHFESVIESHLLANGYVAVGRDGFDRERAIPSLRHQGFLGQRECVVTRTLVNVSNCRLVYHLP